MSVRKFISTEGQVNKSNTASELYLEREIASGKNILPPLAEGQTVHYQREGKEHSGTVMEKGHDGSLEVSTSTGSTVLKSGQYFQRPEKKEPTIEKSRPHTPIVSETQRKFFGAELGRAREGKRTRSGMSETVLKRHLDEVSGKKLPEGGEGDLDAFNIKASPQYQQWLSKFKAKKDASKQGQAPAAAKPSLNISAKADKLAAAVKAGKAYGWDSPQAKSARQAYYRMGGVHITEDNALETLYKMNRETGWRPTQKASGILPDGSGFFTATVSKKPLKKSEELMFGILKSMGIEQGEGLPSMAKEHADRATKKFPPSEMPSRGR